jgi:DNA-binding MarR family transcriptional regulator
VPKTRSTGSRADGPGELEQAAAFRAELRRFLNRTEAATAEAGLTPQRYDLLLAIRAAGGESTINELCTHLDMRQTAVTELVKRAEEAGIVTRTQSSVDRRVVLVRITSVGQGRLERGFAALRADRVALGNALDQLKSAFEAPPLELHPPLEPAAASTPPAVA